MIDGYTLEDDDGADKIDNAGDLCEDCWGENTGYCRCTIWEWGREDGGMTKQQVFSLFKEEITQERTERGFRQLKRKALDDFFTMVDGYTLEDDDDADKIDNAGDLCEDCWGENTGYCRCTIWDWGREDGRMTKQQVFSLFKEEVTQERNERAFRQLKRKARVPPIEAQGARSAN